MFWSGPVYLEQANGILTNLNNPVWIDLQHLKRAHPTRTKLAQEELQMRIEKEDQVTFLKLTTANEFVMPLLHSLLIDSRTFIRIQTDFLKFIQLEHSFLSHRLQIEVQMCDGPISVVLQLHKKVVGLIINQSEWSRLES